MVTWKTDKGCEDEIKADIGEVGYDRMGLEVVKEHVQWSFVISGGESLGSATGVRYNSDHEKHSYEIKK